MADKQSLRYFVFDVNIEYRYVTNRIIQSRYVTSPLGTEITRRLNCTPLSKTLSWKGEITACYFLTFAVPAIAFPFDCNNLIVSCRMYRVLYLSFAIPFSVHSHAYILSMARRFVSRHSTHDLLLSSIHHRFRRSSVAITIMNRWIASPFFSAL